MPTYGDGKTRDMVRSILPSTARKAARADRRFIHKTERARTRNAIASTTVEFIEDLTADAERERDHHIDFMKWDRRQADNVAAAMRWAPKKVKDLRRLDRASKLRTMFPKNLAGRHALSHVMNAEGIYIPYGKYGQWQTRAEMRAGRKEVTKTAKEIMVERVTEMYLMGGHGHFNQCLKHGWPALAPMPTIKIGDRVIAQPWRQARQKDYRPLYGLHDIEAFVDYIHLSSAWGLVERLLAA